MTRLADLHIHTHFSDGSDSPEEVIKQAHRAGLSAIAISDHDTTDGILPAIKAGEEFDIEVIPAMELSTSIYGKDVHILAYCFDPKDKRLQTLLKRFQEARLQRVERMIEKLKEAGITGITVEEVTRRAQSGAVGRPHLAAVLVEKKIVGSLQQAFDFYLAEGRIAYVDKFKQSPREAIEWINSLGGVAVLAHPMFTNKDELIAGMVEAGLGGIEVYYPNCPGVIINYYVGLARKYNLVMTGGSDAHGRNKPNTFVGKKTIPYELVDALKERARQHSPKP